MSMATSIRFGIGINRRQNKMRFPRPGFRDYSGTRLPRHDELAHKFPVRSCLTDMADAG